MPPRRRPPWWPEDEAWPPADWRGGRRRNGWGGGIAGRGAGAFSVLLPDRSLCLFVVGTLPSRSGRWRARRHRQRASHRRRRRPAGPAGGCLRGGTIGRTVGRTVAPIDDLVAAAGRIEGGDYTSGSRARHASGALAGARVQRHERAPRGPRPAAADVPGRRGPRAAHATVGDPGQLEGIEDGLYPADAEHLAPIHAQVKALDKLIDDLRTVALAEAGSLPLERRPTDMAALIDEAVVAFATQPATPGIQFTTDIEDGLPSVNVDASASARS